MRAQDGERMHGLLAAALVSDLAMSVAEVTEADRVGTLAEPSPIAGHRPDVVARTRETLIIGEANLAPSADDHGFVEQLRAWQQYRPTGFERSILTLAVPAGARESAEAAAETAGWDQEHLRVLEVGLPQHTVAG